jgi:hypothetical protein
MEDLPRVPGRLSAQAGRQVAPVRWLCAESGSVQLSAQNLDGPTCSFFAEGHALGTEYLFTQKNLENSKQSRKISKIRYVTTDDVYYL